MILEHGVLDIIPGREAEFETAFREASPIIMASPGYISHQLQRCVEKKGRYLLLVKWESLEAHTTGFRGSDAYLEWKKRLHHFYDPFPTIQHFEVVLEAP